MKTESRSLGQAALILTLIGLFGKGIGFLRELVFARYFGLSEDYEIYLVVSAFPIILITSFMYFWQNFLIPQYKIVKNTNAENHADFIRDSLLMSFLMALIIGLILYSFRGFFFSVLYSSHPGKISMINILLITVIAALVFNSQIMVFTAWHYAERKFSASTFLLSVPSVAVIFSTVFFSGTAGAVVIPLGLSLGYFLQLFILMLYNPERIKIFSGRPLRIFSRINKVFVFTLLIEIVGQLYIVVDRYFFKQIEPGGIAALSYAHTLYLLPLSIISMALASVLFPSFSDAVAEDNQGKLAELSEKAVFANIYLFVPVAAFVYVNSDLLCSLLFQGGKFSQSDAALTAGILRVFSFSYLFYSIYSFLNRLFYSIGKAGVLFGITCILVACKFLLNYLLASKYGVTGLAFSTSVVYVLFFLGSFIYLKSKNILSFNKYFIINFFLTSVFGYLSILVSTYCVFFSGSDTRKISLITNLLTSSVVASVLYLFSLWFVGGKQARIFLTQMWNGLFPRMKFENVT